MPRTAPMVIATAQLMTVLDDTVAHVVLRSIRTQSGMSESALRPARRAADVIVTTSVDHRRTAGQAAPPTP